MFSKVAKYMNKVISYPSYLASAASMVGMVFVVVAVVVDVIMRYFFNSPIYGLWDLCALAFVLIVWGPMAMGASKGSHVAMTFLVDKLPRLPRLGLEVVVNLVTAGILGIVSWRLVLHGIVFGETKVVTGILRIAYEPFVYFAAFSCAVMALVFLARVPEILGKMRKEPEAAGEIHKEPEAAEKMEKMKGSGA
jgi:TRAP-type C4-dicarboxylate transport system permease small subunit